MCGIAGILSNDTAKAQRIHAMTGALTHRGPEAEGYYTNATGTVALGHRRLCIIDLTPAAAQPMRYANRYRVIHNGEIYNYKELRTQLQHKGHHFTSASDTEVIAAAYAEYGTACLQQFDGMFAFAIWDEQEQKLFAARDRMGEKPFYYYYKDGQFLFASEIKAFWKAGVHKNANEALLYNFLTIGYTSNPYAPDETFYKNIYRLSAACFLNYSLKEDLLRIENYWQPVIEINQTISERQAVEQLGDLLQQSVNLRLRSDVAIGTSLSGGLDSSTIVALCAQAESKQYSHQCFTAVFEGYEKNEWPYADRVAKKFGLQHHTVRISAEEIQALMNDVMQQQDEPFSSASPLAQYKVYEAARRAGVPVLLDGQGADELLAGYHKYYKWYWQELYRKGMAAKEIEAAKALGINQVFGVKEKMASLLPDFAAALLQSTKRKQALHSSFLNQEFAHHHRRDFYYSLPAKFDLNNALYFNSFQVGLDELLRLADRNSMAHAVEVRLPFLSHTIVDFLFTLPASYKIKNGWTKWLLREAMQPLLPEEIVWRKDKVGFEPPQKIWMQNAQVQQAIQAGKEKLVKAGILNRSVMEKKIQPHDAHAAESSDWKFWSASFLIDQG